MPANVATVVSISSPATCGRGLKLPSRRNPTPNLLSPATCGRGLKQSVSRRTPTRREIARHVRAWIETIKDMGSAEAGEIARHVRAWIETAPPCVDGDSCGRSPATCGRGLKHQNRHRLSWPSRIARHVRAWIETCRVSSLAFATLIARHVRAWIETLFKRFGYSRSPIARHVRAWIETARIRDACRLVCRSPATCGRGLKHARQSRRRIARRYRPPRAGVD